MILQKGTYTRCVLQKANHYLQKTTIPFDRAIIENQKAYQVFF